MKILWTVNNFPPQIAKEFGYPSGHAISWVDAMGNRLKGIAGIELAIAAPKGRLKEPISKKIGGITYYSVPSVFFVEAAWKKVIDEFKPDVIHAYGTEQKHNLVVEKVATNIPIVVSLQGIITEYTHHYYAGIDIRTIIRNITLHDIITRNSILAGKERFKKRSKTEIQILKGCKNVEGRSTWDRVSSKAINPDLNYYYCPRMLRAPFYKAKKWDIATVVPHTIFVSQGNYPIKGLHFVLEALHEVLKRYPDTMLIVTGSSNITDEKTSFIRGNGYLRYLKYLVDVYNLKNNIRFIGSKDAEGMAEQYQQAHIAVVSSSIENAPNSLAEAMIIGTPVIASYVGGNMDMVEHGVSGLLYCYNEPHMLSEYICNIFDSDMLAKKISSNAIKAAEERHNPEQLLQQLLSIYHEIK